MPAPSERPSARERTREDLYQLIRSTRDVTRNDLVDRTGLPMSTVAHSVRRLIEDGRVYVTDSGGGGRGTGSGRPRMTLNAVPQLTKTAAIDFGHGHIAVALGNDRGELSARDAFPMEVDLNAQDAIDQAAERLLAMHKETGDKVPLAYVVAGIPGPIERNTGRVGSATILSSWVGLDPAEELKRRLGVEVHVENDAALGAYGELRAGAGRRLRDFIYVKASHGIGAGLVANDQLYTGALGLAGEIGHTQLAARAELCRCGNRGCLEAVVSVQQVLEQLNHTHPHQHFSRLSEAPQDDPVTRRLLEEAGRTLGRVLADVCNLLNPSAIIIGGELGTSGEAFIEGVRSSITRHAQPASIEHLMVIEAELGSDSQVVGALRLCGELAAANSGSR